MSKRNVSSVPASSGSSDKSCSDAAASTAASSESNPAVAAAAPVGRYSPDAAEQEIAALRAEAAVLDRARARAGGVETPAARLRAIKLAAELAQKIAALKAYRREQSGIAITALAVLLLISVVWILLGWENPLKWMERINKEQRHEAMLRNRGPL